ncbi:hypothetical protein [Pseudoflavitalea rhizosphaerae]|uniref:hypothetical protein n=1 Tax=Pseudoflavitalea rhizosphaerae TaxID=1884793 RepID=UPI000F8C8054|nr:hypothetical protein [Pseudoflavitalea rhizosphaerae]
MKQLSIPVILALLFSASCNFSQGVKKDLNTGLTTHYKGFRIDDSYLEDESGNKISSNKVDMGTTLFIIANGVTNYKEKNGRVYPGCKIVLTDASGKELLNLPDAFADMKDGFNPEEATKLSARLSTGDPMQKGSNYNLKATFFDKENKENLIVSEVKLEMK